MKQLYSFVIISIISLMLCSAQSGENIRSTKQIQYYHAIEIGTGIDVHNSPLIPWGISVKEIHGILFNPHIALGLNFEFQYIDNFRADKTRCDNYLFSGGLDLRYFILKKYKWTPFLIFEWNGGICLVNTSNQRIMEYADVMPFFDKVSIFAGCNYTFSEKRSVYLAAGYDVALTGPSLKIGVRF